MKIEKYSIINSGELNQEFYFQSLLEEAVRKGLLLIDEAERIQYECLELMSNQCEKYTSKKCSSVRIEFAEDLMASNLYTIGLYLKTFNTADEAVEHLKNTKIKDIYDCGRKRINVKLNTAKQLYTMVMDNILKSENYAYNATIIDGIRDFFKLYNPDYAAHKYHITADYPICNSDDKYTGIEFIQNYLEAVYYENMFCGYFSPEGIHKLLYSYNENYGDIVFNIFQCVLYNSIACQLVGTDIRKLEISKEEILQLKNRFYGKLPEEISSDIYSSFKNIAEAFEIKSKPLIKYIKISLLKMVAGISEGLISNYIILSKQIKEKNKIIFSWGEKMDNLVYSLIIEALKECESEEKRINIIKENVQSLIDIDNIIFDAELSANEVYMLLEHLGATEIAAMAKRYPYNNEFNDYDQEKEKFSIYLNDYIMSLTDEKQRQIKGIINML